MSSNNNGSDKMLKFLLIGDAYVGKSCLLNTFNNGKATNDYVATIGVDFASKSYVIDAVDLKIQIWDTSGQKRFSTIIASYFRGASGIIIMFDITDKKTFDNVQDWLAQVRSFCGDDVQILLVGNKLDLASERQVELNEAEDFAAKEKIEYLEICARDRSEVDGVIIDLSRLVLANRQKGYAGSDGSDSSVVVPDRDKGQCCSIS